MVETDLKKEVFLFDHVAHQYTNQSDIYKLIGKDAVATSFEVSFHRLRDITAAYLLMGKLEQVKHTQLWEILMH